MLVTFASAGRTDEPAANASHAPPPTNLTDGQETLEVGNATDPDIHDFDHYSKHRSLVGTHLHQASIFELSVEARYDGDIDVS